jgi:hypothetical protein
MARPTAVALVGRLVVDKVVQKPVLDELMARRNAVDALCVGLLTHPDDGARELCAELLGDMHSTKAVPPLIEALRDRSVHVRWDALRALSKLLYCEIGWWLRIEGYKSQPGMMHRRVSAWWKRNRSRVWW